MAGSYRRIISSFVIVAGATLWAMSLEAPLRIHERPDLRRLLGYIGVAAIAVSFFYSMRKRKIIFSGGHIASWLNMHEVANVAGSFVIFLHAGFHAHAVVPFAAFFLMLTSFVSGVIGRYIYQQAKYGHALEKEKLEERGLTPGEIDDRLAFIALASSVLGRWRDFHMPLVFVFIFFIFYHAVSALYFGGF